MSITTQFPVFRFASLRNPKPAAGISTATDVMPETALVTSLIEINESASSDEQKINDTNNVLQNYINSGSFLKTRLEFFGAIDPNAPSELRIQLMYDNLIVRQLTKSNTNEVYGLLVQYIRAFAAELNQTTPDNVTISLPERLVFNFTEYAGTNSTTPPDDVTSILDEMGVLMSVQRTLEQARRENVLVFEADSRVTKRNLAYAPLHSAFGAAELDLNEANSTLNARLAGLEVKATTERPFPQTEEVFTGTTSARMVDETNLAKTLNDIVYNEQLQGIVQKALNEGVTLVSDTETVSDANYDTVLEDLGATGAMTLEAAEKETSDRISGLFHELHRVMPGQTYALVAGTWQNVSPVLDGTIEQPSNPEIVVYHQGCFLKYPVQVADLRVVEQQAVGYLPAEIAHISNTQRGEKNTRVTRRLKKVETAETLISESEVTRETDSQSAEKFSIESEASNVQQEENSWNINASVSYTLGPLSANVSGGYNSSSLELSSNSTAQQYAREIFTRVLDRVSNRTRVERSLKTVEEFEETVTHEIDNSTAETKSYVYRWLNKLVRGTLKNYGKRLIFQFDVAHPAHYYLTRAIREQPTLNIPTDPREYKVNGVAFHPGMILPSNYLAWGKLYEARLENPPPSKIIVSESFSASAGLITNKQIPVKAGYACKHAIVKNMYTTGWPGGHALVYMIGMGGYAYWGSGDDFWAPRTVWLSNETDNVPVSIFHAKHVFLMNVEVHCELTPEALNDWQVKCYYAILDAYESLKAKAEAKVNEFDPNAPGLHPMKKMELIRTELKKEAIRKMYRCNPFWLSDSYEVGKEYNPDCCLDSANSEKVRFLETVFDWQNMTYELHPYFYNNKSQWNKVLDLQDDDPHFEAFLKASYATVRVPVFRDKLKEIAACNFIVNNAVGNYETIPQGLADLLEELEEEPASLFTYDLEGNELPVPKSTVDLGIFSLPTSLVILECTNQDGVSPIGFPQTAEEATDVSIPKQYSPAIIGDSCLP